MLVHYMTGEFQGYLSFGGKTHKFLSKVRWHILLKYRGTILKSYTQDIVQISVSLLISIIIQFNKYFSNVYFSSTMPVARDAEIITICNSQALPRVFFLSYVRPCARCFRDIISFQFFHCPVRYSYSQFTYKEKEA